MTLRTNGRWLALRTVVVLGGAILLLVLVAGCKSAATLEAERDGTSSPSATATVEGSATPEASATTVTSVNGSVRYIANTGGRGVSLRSACRTDARVSGALPEGTRVEVLESGTGTCDGWTYAVAGATETWVSNQFLTTTRGVSSGGGGGSTSGSGGSAGSGGTPQATATSGTLDAVPGHFVVERWWFTSGSVGQKVLHLTVYNDSPETLDQYIVDICILDAAGREIKEYGHGFSCFRWSDLQVRIPPGTSYTPNREWPLHAYEGVTSVRITRVFGHTTANHFWRP